jgi:two-component system, chemotaxis family, protein-glutamate methylesterase/glutaminase
MIPGRDIIVVGASAGGVEALSQLVRHLPADLPAAIFVVLHVPAHSPSLLPQILNRSRTLPATHATDAEPIRKGRIYVAPPDQHLLLEDDQVRVKRGPRENGHRPAVDPLFRTAARSFGPRVVGVVLSGTLDDGTAGLVAIKQRSGLTVVQDPREALYTGMPLSALEAVAVDYSLPVSQIAGLLERLAREPFPEPVRVSPSPERIQTESQIAAFDMDAIEDEDRPGQPSVFACPDCGGTLWELHDGDLTRFRCRVGHAWTANGLLAEQSNGIETALWSALRALEERAVLCSRISQRMRDRGLVASAERFARQEHDSRQRASILRQVLISEPMTNDEPAPEESESGQGDDPPEEKAPDG